jgi:hypothetical protein
MIAVVKATPSSSSMPARSMFRQAQHKSPVALAFGWPFSSASTLAPRKKPGTMVWRAPLLASHVG